MHLLFSTVLNFLASVDFALSSKSAEDARCLLTWCVCYLICCVSRRTSKVSRFKQRRPLCQLIIAIGNIVLILALVCSYFLQSIVIKLCNFWFLAIYIHLQLLLACQLLIFWDPFKTFGIMCECYCFSNLLNSHPKSFPVAKEFSPNNWTAIG